MRHEDALTTLRESTTAASVINATAKPTVNQEERRLLINVCIAALRFRDQEPFLVIHDIEVLAKEGKLAATPNNGTVFQAMANAIRAAGFDIGDTVGDFQARTGATDENIHDIACECHDRQWCMSAATAAGRMEQLRDGTLGTYRAYHEHSMSG